MSMQKSKEYPLTPEILKYFHEWAELDDAKTALTKPTGVFRKSVNTQALIELCKATANANTQIWLTVRNTYPELTGKAASINENSIKTIN